MNPYLCEGCESVSWCPNCKVEYRDGFTHCNDCGAELVDEMAIKSEENKDQRRKTPKTKKEVNKKTKIKHIEEVFLVNVGNEVETIYITSMLEQESIPYNIVEESSGQYLSILHGRSFFGKSIYVSRDDYSKAATIIDSCKTDMEPKNSVEINKKNIGILGVKFIIWCFILLGVISIVFLGVSIFN